MVRVRADRFEQPDARLLVVPAEDEGGERAVGATATMSSSGR